MAALARRGRDRRAARRGPGHRRRGPAARARCRWTAQGNLVRARADRERQAGAGRRRRSRRRARQPGGLGAGRRAVCRRPLRPWPSCAGSRATSRRPPSAPPAFSRRTTGWCGSCSAGPPGAPPTAAPPPAPATGRRPPASTAPIWSSSRSATRCALPEVLGPSDAAGTTPEGLLISAGTGETMAAAFGLGVGVGDAVVSLGASGSVMAVHHEALADPSGMITSFADATGMHLPVVHTSNAVRDPARHGADARRRRTSPNSATLALNSTPGACGLVLLPYLEGERTPRLPHAAGTLSGLRRESMKPEHLARAAFEGMLCSLADALDVLRGARGRGAGGCSCSAPLPNCPPCRRPRRPCSVRRSWCRSPPSTRRSARPGRRPGRSASRRARSPPHTPPAWQGAVGAGLRARRGAGRGAGGASAVHRDA